MPYDKLILIPGFLCWIVETEATGNSCEKVRNGEGDASEHAEPEISVPKIREQANYELTNIPASSRPTIHLYGEVRKMNV